MRIGVIVDDMAVAAWQARAHEMLPPDTEFSLYNCTNTRPGKRRIRHALYYALNLAAIRNRMTRSGPVGDLGGRIVARTDFRADDEGAWQRLADDLLARIAEDRPAAIVKFGMNLLRIPPELTAPILSYHHGDPEAYRGRPAGFYELLHGRRTMGQIVQILSNRLDAGTVVAFAETKVHPHSYRATLVEAYRASPLLLGRAIDAAVRGEVLAKNVEGKVYRLPGNGAVFRFCLETTRAAAARLAYGALREKRWQVSTAAAAPEAVLGGFPPRPAWRTLPCPRGYTFLADPFFAPGGAGILAEALHAASGKGEILHFRGSEPPLRLSDPTRHYSYPASVEEEGRHFIVPETAFWSPAHAYETRPGGWGEGRELDVPGRPQLIDPTLFRQRGDVYLFANGLDEGSGILRLWRAPSLFARFEEHPASPVLISPAGARMAGEIVALPGGRPMRLGQDDSGGYGDGLLVFAIDALDPETYRERPAGSLRFQGVKGPHTLNFRQGTALFDWYCEALTPFAGLRRLRGRLHRPSGLGRVSASSVIGQNL